MALAIMTIAIILRFGCSKHKCSGYKKSRNVEAAVRSPAQGELLSKMRLDFQSETIDKGNNLYPNL